ncbi:integral membrane protein [Ilyonectria robusta]
MVASSPMLRPIFDRTALKWLGISLRSTREESTGGAVRSRATGGGGTRRTSQGPSHTRPGGFQQMHESEEHLAWEMATMNGKFNGTQLTRSIQPSTIGLCRTSKQDLVLNIAEGQFHCALEGSYLHVYSLTTIEGRTSSLRLSAAGLTPGMETKMGVISEESHCTSKPRASNLHITHI